MKRFSIARYLSSEQIDRALAAKYRMIQVKSFRPRLRTVGPEDDQYCPLGVALDIGIRAPISETVEMALSKTRKNAAILRAAEAFIEANDTGQIKPEDLPSALGR